MKGYIGCPTIKHGGDRAGYSPVLDYVQMPSKKRFSHVDSYFATLFHELVHSTGHEKRLARTEWTGFSSDSYSKEELVAECGSAFLCGIAGIAKPELDENTTAYIQSWLKRLQNDPKLVVKAAAAAQTACDLITGHSEKKSVESETPEDVAVA